MRRRDEYKCEIVETQVASCAGFAMALRVGNVSCSVYMCQARSVEWLAPVLVADIYWALDSGPSILHYVNVIFCLLEVNKPIRNCAVVLMLPRAGQ